VEQRIDRVNATQPGIIAYLAQKGGGGNPHERGLVQVTASLPWAPQPEYSQPHRVLDPAETGYISQAQTEPFIQIAFVGREIVVTQYRVRSWYSGRSRTCNMRSWKLEGSITRDDHWVILDQRQPPETNDLTDTVDRTYAIDPSKHQKWSKLRLTQTGNDSSAWGGLTLSWIEFYGVLFE
jgi:hypothetical protein